MKVTMNGVEIKLDLSEVPVPTEIPVKGIYDSSFDFFIEKLDYMNYSLMEGTEFTEFLYRLSVGMMEELRVRSLDVFSLFLGVII